LKIVLKVVARKAGISRLDLAAEKLILQFSASHQRNPAGMVDMITAAPKQFELSPEGVLKAKLAPGNLTKQLGQAKILLKEIAQRVNSIHRPADMSVRT
jgi:transcription-repair coupling factor (superfamily II helicase)